jgi:Cu(I)/Ag(I) efflux system membrane protein CusA/SilA
MIERIIEFSIRNRILIFCLAGILVIVGVYSVLHTPVDAIPDLSENQVIVFTDWMGHSPREVEDQVTFPLSNMLQGLPGVRVVRASSDFGFSMINVILEDSVDFYFARQQVAERLTRAAADLPGGVVPRLAPDALATGQIFWYTVEGAGYDLGRLRDIQDWFVRGQLSSVPGVAEVATVGGYPVEYQIDVDPLRLRAKGVTLAGVAEAVTRSNSAVGGHVIQKAGSEYLVRGVGLLGSSAQGGRAAAATQVIRDLEEVVVPARGGSLVRLGDIARITLAAQPRRGVLEKDGNEVTGGVVLMRRGENPLEVTRGLKQKIQELQTGLPPGVRVVPMYDRTPLIEGAIGTVTRTLLEAILTATVCVLIVLLHFRTSFIIAITLPLAVLSSFAIMALLRRLGLADIQTNIMSLAGIAISIGVLVDSSIVMAENAMHHLKTHFGDRRVHGDVRAIVLPACRTVGRPIFFSVFIMLLSFLPVFALGGLEGKMFHPLAFTKSFALLAVAVLAVTLVPALCTVFIKGRLRTEEESWLVRSVIEVYRPVLAYFLARPGALVWLLGTTFLVGLAPLGNRVVLQITLLGALLASLFLIRRSLARALALASLVLIALAAEQNIKQLEREFITPLDEGMVMDMPITWPRASVTQSADDLKARDMVFCRFPEVDMVVGKAGRAETPTDPAPLDMIETMINFRQPELWPRRKLDPGDAERQAAAVLDALAERGLVRVPAAPAARADLINTAVMEGLPRYDALMREYAYQRNQEFERGLAPLLVRRLVERMAALLEDNGSLRHPLRAGELSLLTRPVSADVAHYLVAGPALEDITQLARQTARNMVRLGMVESGNDVLVYRPGPLPSAFSRLSRLFGAPAPTFFTELHDAVTEQHRRLWLAHVRRLDGELVERAAATFTRLILEEILRRAPGADPRVAALTKELKRLRTDPPAAHHSVASHHHHHGGEPASQVAAPEPLPELDAVQTELTHLFARGLLLWRKECTDLTGPGGELDRVMQMPGWTNVWTMPIQNRVDMLATGVNTTVGIRVLGRRLDDVVRASERIAAVVKGVRGASGVVADPVRGKGYLEVHIDRKRAARLGVSAADVNEVVETALGGKVVTTTIEGRTRHPVRVRFPRASRESEESVRELLVGVPGSTGRQVPLSRVADVRILSGPATIKSENGLLRNYVRLNVRNRDAAEFVAEARRVVAEQVQLPEGVYLEWTGQFEHEVRARGTLTFILPLVVALIFGLLYLTYHDLADAVLMLLAVPGAIAGGVFFQWLFGCKFSVTVWVGYIACFGMATATGVIMLVYLREAVAKAGGLEKLSLDQLRRAVLDGAVHRLRPKLLTELTCVIGLAPLLWAKGTGAEVIKPMVVPVLGGILVADEVIDLFLPVLFFWVRRRRWERLHRFGSDLVQP